MLLEIHHQALLDERIDPDHAVTADVRVPQGRKLEVADGVRSDGELADLHAVDDVAVGHAVQDHGRSERQFQALREAQADDRSVGAAIDDEFVRAASIDEHVDAKTRVDLARLHVLSADGERRVELRRRQRRHVGRTGRSGLGLADLGWVRGRDGMAGRRQEHQTEREDQNAARPRQWVLSSSGTSAHYPAPRADCHAL